MALGSLRTLKGAQFFEWVSNKCDAAQRIVSTMTTLVEGVLPEALGPPGTPGDPEKILYVAKTLAAAYASAIEWGLEFHRRAVPEELDRVRLLASGFFANVIREVEEFTKELRRAINEAVHVAQPGEKRTVAMTLTLTAPDVTDLEKEIARLRPLYRDGILDWN